MTRGGQDLRDDASLNSGQTSGSGRDLHEAQAFNRLGSHPPACGVPLALEADLWLFRLGRYLVALCRGHDIPWELVDHH